jgi:hypothetical protein
MYHLQLAKYECSAYWTVGGRGRHDPISCRFYLREVISGDRAVLVDEINLFGPANRRGTGQLD